MLNRAARFFPILERIEGQLAAGATLLEVGSGSIGLGEFWKGPFVGCDIEFASAQVANMRPVRCSGHQLPFSNGAFDVIVVSDVMEHVPPPLRQAVVEEVLRVARHTAVFGYPCGPAAFEADEKLRRDYRRRNMRVPEWLEEHMLYPFPDEKLFQNLSTAWKVRVMPNESLHFHSWIMRKEMSRIWNHGFRMLLRLMPALVKHAMRRFDAEPSYRKIFVLTRSLEGISA